MARDPVCILFSGKRKSGKDYVVSQLVKLLGENECEVIRLSGPLKKQYAVEHGLNFEKLLDSSGYKERYRKSMIEWGEMKRKEDPDFFCNLATKDASKPIWVISDARRRTDIKYFRERFKMVHVRIGASEETRTSRGWSFIPGIDDAESECDLDSETFDIFVNNSGDSQTLQNDLDKVIQLTKSASGAKS